MSVNSIASPKTWHYEPILESTLTASRLNKLRRMEQLTHLAIALLALYSTASLAFQSKKQSDEAFMIASATLAVYTTVTVVVLTILGYPSQKEKKNCEISCTAKSSIQRTAVKAASVCLMLTAGYRSVNAIPILSTDLFALSIAGAHVCVATFDQFKRGGSLYDISPLAMTAAFLLGGWTSFQKNSISPPETYESAVGKVLQECTDDLGANYEQYIGGNCCYNPDDNSLWGEISLNDTVNYYGPGTLFRRESLEYTAVPKGLCLDLSKIPGITEQQQALGMTNPWYRLEQDGIGGMGWLPFFPAFAAPLNLEVSYEDSSVLGMPKTAERILGSAMVSSNDPICTYNSIMYDYQSVARATFITGKDCRTRYIVGMYDCLSKSFIDKYKNKLKKLDRKRDSGEFLPPTPTPSLSNRTKELCKKELAERISLFINNTLCTLPPFSNSTELGYPLRIPRAKSDQCWGFPPVDNEGYGYVPSINRTTEYGYWKNLMSFSNIGWDTQMWGNSSLPHIGLSGMQFVAPITVAIEYENSSDNIPIYYPDGQGTLLIDAKDLCDHPRTSSVIHCLSEEGREWIKTFV